MLEESGKRENKKQSKISSNRHSGMVVRSRISGLMLSMFATVASLYVAGRLWQEAQDRVFLTKELDKITGQGHSAISVDDTLKIIACREQHKKLSALEMELTAAKQEGFVSKHSPEDIRISSKRPLVVIGVLTKFGRKNNRDAIRKAWMATGRALKKMEDQKGIISRFIIGRSSSHGDNLDRSIANENKQTNDFLILENHVEAPEDHPKKTKLFFALAAEKWEADFYAKINDDVYVNIDALGNTLAAYADKPRIYIGCMKSGEVFSEQSQRWYEPDWWKFGDGQNIHLEMDMELSHTYNLNVDDLPNPILHYFRHASGEMFVISRALAKFISINRSILRTYAHDDISAGSWFIGVDVIHADERKFCCSSWSSGAICSGV